MRDSFSVLISLFSLFLLLGARVFAAEGLEELRSTSLASLRELRGSSSCVQGALQDLETTCASLDDSLRARFEVRLLNCMLQEAGRELQPCGQNSRNSKCVDGFSISDDFTVSNLITVKANAAKICGYYALLASHRQSADALLQLRNSTNSLTASISQLQQLHFDLNKKIMAQLQFFDEAEARQRQLEHMQMEVHASVEAVALYVQNTHKVATALLGSKSTWHDLALYLSISIVIIFWFQGFRRIGLLALVVLSISLDRCASHLLSPYLNVRGSPSNSGSDGSGLEAILVLRVPTQVLTLLPPLLRPLLTHLACTLPLRDLTRVSVLLFGLAVCLLSLRRNQEREKPSPKVPTPLTVFDFGDGSEPSPLFYYPTDSDLRQVQEKFGARVPHMVAIPSASGLGKSFILTPTPHSGSAHGHGLALTPTPLALTSGGFRASPSNAAGGAAPSNIRNNTNPNFPVTAAGRRVPAMLVRAEEQEDDEEDEPSFALEEEGRGSGRKKGANPNPKKPLGVKQEGLKKRQGGGPRKKPSQTEEETATSASRSESEGARAREKTKGGSARKGRKRKAAEGEEEEEGLSPIPEEEKIETEVQDEGAEETKQRASKRRK